MDPSLGISRPGLRVFCMIAAILLALGGCSSYNSIDENDGSIGSETGDPGEGGQSPSPGVTTGQAVLGPLTGAAVAVFRQDDLQRPVYATVTTSSPALSRAGLFDIPASSLADDPLYVIHIYGGRDIDAEDDGEVDDTPTDNLGTLHLAATGAQLKSGGFKANILSDIVYHSVSYMLLARYPLPAVSTEIDYTVQRLLEDDVDGDHDLDMDDVLTWDPVLDKDKTDWDWSFFRELVAAVHDDAVYIEELDRVRRSIADWIDTRSDVRAMASAGDYVLTVDGERGLTVIDTGNARQPTIHAVVRTPGSARDVAAAGNYAYVADGDAGVQVVDIGAAGIVAGIPTSLEARHIAVSAGYACVADRFLGLEVLDVHDPSHPYVTGRLNLFGAVRDLTLSNGFVYVVLEDEGLQVIDIRDPARPYLAGRGDTPENARAVAVAGDIACVADGSGGLQVIDVADPWRPAIIGSVQTPGEAVGVTLSGRFAYVGDEAVGVVLIDVGDPTAPAIVSSIFAREAPRGLLVSGGRLYTADEDRGVNTYRAVP